MCFGRSVQNLWKFEENQMEKEQVSDTVRSGEAISLYPLPLLAETWYLDPPFSYKYFFFHRGCGLRD
jgi:hypothetical protein